MMTPAVQSLIAACAWSPTEFLVFSSNVFDPLIYYSHFFPLAIALALGLFVFIKSHRQLSSKVLFGTIVLLAVWLFSDMVVWATEQPALTMFFWSLVNLVEPMIYAGMFYFVYLFLFEKDISLKQKAILFLLLAPTVLLTPTHFSLFGYDISNCDRDAIEGVLTYYNYVIELIFVLWMLCTAFRRFKTTAQGERRKIVLVTAGSVGFLLAFAFGNIIGSLFDSYSVGGEYSWTIGQYGLFGIPIFTALLTYLIVRYRALNIKVIGTQALVFGLTIIIGSELFFVTSPLNQVLVVITLLLSILISYFLVQSIKKEIKAKEDLAVANIRLKELDKQKTEFVSFATHQLRSPLASMKGYASLMLDGDLGPLTTGLREAIQTIFSSSSTLANVVDDYLNISRIELGTMKYDMKVLDFKDLARNVINEQKPNIAAKELTFKVDIDESQKYMIKADQDKFKQVVMNIVDNSVKYTPQGSLTIGLTKKDGKVRFSVSDTGVGIDPRVMPKLFQKFSRAPDAGEANIHGTGLGLFIARQIMEAHGGRVWAESAGVDQGSQFYIELPEVK